MIHSGWKVPVLFSTASTNPLASVPWVAQWKFNNNGNDSIGANHLTNNNSATFTTGLLGGATGATQLVRSSGQYWSIANNSALQTGNIDFTICAWVYLDSKPAASMDICSRSDNSNPSAHEYILSWSQPTDRFVFLIDPPAGTNIVLADTFGSPSTGVWYCVIAGYDVVNNNLFISVNDGPLDTITRTVSITTVNVATTIGYREGTTQRGWDGRIDNVCIAKSAAGGGGVLTAAQRTAFYNGGSGTEQLT